MPDIGKRIHILGGLAEFADARISDDSIMNDAIWRATPKVCWRIAHVVANNGRAHADLTDDMDDTYHTGGYKSDRGKELRRRIMRRRMLTWRVRSMQSDVRELEKLTWVNVSTARRGSLELGPHGVVGREGITETGHYPGSYARPSGHSVDDENYTGNFAWVANLDHRYAARDLSAFRVNDMWWATYPKFPYKKIWYDEQACKTGLYRFQFEPYVYELIRLVTFGRFDFPHLEAPEWMANAISDITCHRPWCPDYIIPKFHAIIVPYFSLECLVECLLQCADPHVSAFAHWILTGRGYRVSRYAWSTDAMSGRCHWELNGTRFGDAETPRSFTTGMNRTARQTMEREQLTTFHARSRLTWEERRKTTQVKSLATAKWPNVDTGEGWHRPNRVSLQLGPHGSVGEIAIKEFDRYPGSSALAVDNSLDDEDFAANFTWLSCHGDRYSTSELTTHLGYDQWACKYPLFACKRVWYAERAFNTGAYGFHFEPYIRELLRLIHRRKLPTDHLFPPAWFVGAIGELLCRRKGCPGGWGGMCSRQGIGRITFQEIIQALLRRIDPHTRPKIDWILGGGGCRVSLFAWSLGAQTGRFPWGRAGAQYNHGDTPRTYTTGGMASEFDRRIALMLEHEKFLLLTSGVGDKTRSHYMTYWRRWAQVSACMGLSPWRFFSMAA